MLLILNVFDNPAASTILEIAETETLDLLKQMIEVQLGIPYDEQQILLADKLLIDGNLLEIGLQSGSSIVVKRIKPAISSVYDIPSNISPADLLQLTINSPQLLEQLRGNDPELAGALTSHDVPTIRMLMMQRFLQKHKIGYKRERELAEIEADPMNEDNQRKIEDAIRQANVQQNMELAMENLPESFGVVQMLYVNIFVNDNPICAFVDSGAQSTIMSEQCARRCGLIRLIDSRFAGQAQGVGTSKILGRIHIAQMKFGDTYFPISITVIESNNIDFLFGLDMLKRYRCCIDLSRNVLRIDLPGAQSRYEAAFVELPFLSEGEVETAKSTAAIADQALMNPSNNAATDEAAESGATPARLSISSGAGSSRVSTGLSDYNHHNSSSTSSAAVDVARSDNRDIGLLLALGFNESDCIAALQQADGNVDLAATLLMETRMMQQS